MSLWQRYNFRYGGSRYLVCQRLHASKIAPADAVLIEPKSARLIAKAAPRGHSGARAGTHDYGTSWLNEFIGAAGTHYQNNYRASHASAVLMSINDASKPHGGDTKDHKGHETGLDIDVRLPRTDGKSGGITVNSSLYDRDAMRAILKAFKAQTGCQRVFLSDSTLIAEGLCKALGGHDNHAHVGISAPARKD